MKQQKADFVKENEKRATSNLNNLYSQNPHYLNSVDCKGNFQWIERRFKMKTYAIIAMALLVLSVMPMVLATDVGTGVGINVNTQQFAPKVWMCGDRVTYDDNTQNGANGQLSLDERKHNYAFEGEQISWTVLVMDKNKIEEVSDVVGTIGPTQGAGNDVEVECKRIAAPTEGRNPFNFCSARLNEERLTTFNDDVMSYYSCTYTVESSSTHGEYYITIEAKDMTGLSGTMAENEFWFLNPTIALSIEGDLTFEDVMPGTDAYSNTLLVGNDAEAGSGVLLDMFISGSDFYDPSSSGAACPITNQLALTGVGPDGKLGTADDTGFRYFVTNGAYSSVGKAETDAEGYTAIPYGTEISAAKRIVRYNDAPRGAAPGSTVTELDWNNGNALSPGSEMALTFKLSMPEPCVGDFSEGQIYFWGEAI